jgi:ATP-dependent Lon protease
LEKRTGVTPCAAAECGYIFADAEVARHAALDVFDAYQDCKKQTFEQQLLVTMEAAKKREIEHEMQRLQQMTEEQREIDLARREIEGMLELKCPQCKFVFDIQDIFDANECMALKCQNPQCRQDRGYQTQFCAWCWVDCNQDAHGHVSGCHYKPVGADVFYADRAQYDSSQQARLTASVLAYVSAKSAAIQVRIVQACRTALLDNYNLHEVVDLFDVMPGEPEAEVPEDPEADDFALALRLQMEDLQEDGDGRV